MPFEIALPSVSNLHSIVDNTRPHMPYKVVSRRVSCSALVFVWVVSSLAAVPLLKADDHGGQSTPHCSCARTEAARPTQGAWHRVESANFQVWARGEQSARQLAEKSEGELVRLRKVWPAEGGDDAWQPKCVLVLQSSLAEYQHAIKNPRDRSVGMATFVVKKGQICDRRIDLRSDAADWSLGALPHELTHLVLADSFSARPLPAWIDEGLAVLSECPHKQARRRIELDRALTDGGTIPVALLLSSGGRPRSYSLDVFYSQSASLADFLVRYQGPDQFRAFVGRSRKVGGIKALRETYEIGDATQLERLWKKDQLARQAQRGSVEHLVIQP